MIGKTPRRGPRARVYTQEVMQAIPRWAEEGVSSARIAAALGVTRGALLTRCSQHGISLRTDGGAAAGLAQRVGAARWAKLQAHAGLRGLTPMQLAARILCTVLDGNLIDPVLDDGDEVDGR